MLGRLGPVRLVSAWNRLASGPSATCVVLLEAGEEMTPAFAELDIVEVAADQDSGLVEGAHGTVVALSGDVCTVEFLDSAGYTIGLFEIPASDLRLVPHNHARASLARED